MTIGREILHSIWFVRIRRNKAILCLASALQHPHREPLA